MVTQKIEKAKWRPFLDFLTKLLAGKRAEIEVASLAVGDQIEAEWLPLIGLVYDPKDDLIEVALEGHDHLIHHPRELYFAEDAGQFMSLEMVDAEGNHEIVKLKDPLMLPAPQH
jgi:hypothetical protein